MSWRPEQIQLPENTTERAGPMSDAAWCNINDKETNTPFQVGHPFNADDEDREHFTKTRKVNVETGNSYGRPTYQERQEVTETLDMCGYHSRKQAGLFQTADPEPLEIETVEAEADQSEADMWRAKYEAERAKSGFVADSRGRVSPN